MKNTPEAAVRRYSRPDRDIVFALIQREGAEWADYWQGRGRARYERALDTSITYVVVAGGAIRGYARCRDDDGFGIYVCDLLVDQSARGHGYGRMLMDAVCRDHPQDTVYVMSDVDGYYEKLGYQREGSIFAVRDAGAAGSAD